MSEEAIVCEESDVKKPRQDSGGGDRMSGGKENADTLASLLSTGPNEDLQKKPHLQSGVTVKLQVIYAKQKYDVLADTAETIAILKDRIESITGVPAGMQKLMYKGMTKDAQTVEELKMCDGAKVMLVGSTVDAVKAVAEIKPGTTVKEESGGTKKKEALCIQRPHCVILEKYKMPDDLMVGILNSHEDLPNIPLYGMYNKKGQKVRLTFKMESDELWISTNERTDKFLMNSIKDVLSEPLLGHEQYHLTGFRLGPTEASRYWVYWVPAQYVRAIKRLILGTFMPT